MTEYLDSAYFMKKYGVNAYTMTAYRDKSSFDLVKDEVSRTWTEDELKFVPEVYRQFAVELEE